MELKESHELHTWSWFCFPGSKDILAEALYSLVSQLVEDVRTLPTSIVMLFQALQHHLDQRGVTTPHNSVGIKVCANGVHSKIEGLKGEILDNRLIVH